jgi:hypothetical protein
MTAIRSNLYLPALDSRLPLREWASTLAIAGFVALAALMFGWLAVNYLFGAVFLLVNLLGLCIVARFGFAGLVGGMFALLPWLLVFADVIPPLFKTIWAALAAALFALAALQSRDRSRETPSFHAQKSIFWLGAVCFVLPAAVSLLQEATGDQLIQASKYVLFPVMVWGLMHLSDRAFAQIICRSILWSGALALSTHMALSVVGIGAANTKYFSGEFLGLTDNPHDLAFISSAIGAAALASRLALPLRLAIVGVAAVVTLETGARTALVGLAAAVVVTVIRSRLSFRELALVAVVVVVAFASGATSVFENRLAISEQIGEFQPVGDSGTITGIVQSDVAASGRFAIWRNALDRFTDGSSAEIAVGSGLRSIQEIQYEGLNKRLIGHSDIIDVVIQLGMIGLAGFVLIWSVLLRYARSRIPLVAIGAFAMLNGSLEYSSALVASLALCAAVVAWGPIPARTQEPGGEPPEPVRLKPLTEPS